MLKTSVRKVDVGKITLKPGYLNPTGPSLTFVGGEGLTTSGYVKDGIRVVDNYEGNLKLIDELRREVGESINELHIPEEWYLRLPEFGAQPYTHQIKIGRSGTYSSPHTLDMRTYSVHGVRYIGELLLSLSLENAKESVCLMYNKGKAEIISLPNLEGCSINFFKKQTKGPELILWANPDAPTEKFEEAMKIYLSMIHGLGRLRNFEEEETELFGVFRGTPGEKYELSELLGQEL